MASYYFNENHQLFRQSIREYLAKDIEAHIDSWEEQGEVPKSAFKQFGEMGYFGLPFPEEFGGLNLDFFYTIVYLEEMARLNSAGFGAAMTAHPILALAHIFEEGSTFLKEKYLIPGIKGDLIGCLAITEPGGGSDVAQLRTKAVLEDDHYIVNGSKTFITNGVSSDFLVVALQTKKGMSLMILDRDMPGLSATKLKKLGWKASDTGEIAFDDVRVPKENLLGEEGYGFYYIMQRFELERLVIAVSAIAACEYAMEYTLQYMNERHAFGRPINKFQVLRHRIADLSSQIEACKYYNYYVAQRINDGIYSVKESAMAKLRSTELADQVMYQCLQMFGGYGYMEDYKMARMFRDNRLGTIGGGTSEIMCEIIAKMMIDDVQYSDN